MKVKAELITKTNNEQHETTIENVLAETPPMLTSRRFRALKLELIVEDNRLLRRA